MKRCNFYLDEIDTRLLERASKKMNLSQAAILRLLIRKYVAPIVGPEEPVSTPQSSEARVQ